MAIRLALVPIALAAAYLAASCGSGDEADCEALERQAFDKLDEVIRASRGPCTQDSDCTIVGHSSACHDACERVVLTSSLEAVSTTRAAVNENQCREFSKAECKLEIPPCVPPGNAACVDGVCSEMY